MAPTSTCKPHDGDTVAITLPESTRIWRIRLADIRAPELSEPGGKESRDWLRKRIAGKEVGVFIEWPKKRNLLDVPTFNRLPGVVWCEGVNINEAIVAAGHATKTKPKK
jgi:endonuclease YncB( thermonuclease family)